MRKKSKKRSVAFIPAVEEAKTRNLAEELAVLKMLRIRDSIFISPSRSYEVNAVTGLFASLGSMKMAEESLMDRLRQTKNGLRDFRCAMSALRRTIDRMLASFPEEKAISLLRMKEDMGFKTYMSAQAVKREEGLTVMAMDNLNAIVLAAHEYCKVCDGNCDRCSLGKALDYTIAETRDRGRSWSMMDIGDFNPEA